MSYPELPMHVRQAMAAEGVRVHHHLWHSVRSRTGWEALPEESRQQLTLEGWAAPRFEDDPGSGIDFLGMHRQMIAMVDAALTHAHDPNWPRVTGWDPIPWNDQDIDWPVPAWQQQAPSWATEEEWASYTEVAMATRSPQQVAQMRNIASVLRDPERLRTMSLDQLGSALEWSIHGWMHIRWSGAPPAQAFSVDPDNDWLFLPWSSHVNKHFWKLHGWIDDCIGAWEQANGVVADLSAAWAGPTVQTHHGHGHHGHAMHLHSADRKLLEFLPPLERVPMPMRIRDEVVDALLR